MSASSQRRTTSAVSAKSLKQQSKSANATATTTTTGGGLSSASSGLMSKEEEYLRLNAELEAKTATLVYEADQVLKENEKLLSEASLLTRYNNESYLDSIVAQSKPSSATAARPPLTLKSAKLMSTTAGGGVNALTRNHSDLLNNEFHKVIENMEKNFNLNEQSTDTAGAGDLMSQVGFDDYQAGGGDDDDNDNLGNNNYLMPKQASEMSNDAQIRFLKAKLRVMQEEIDRLNSELKHKDEENMKLLQRCKDLDDEKQRGIRQVNANQQQLDKTKKQNDEYTQKITSLDVQFQNMKKDYEQCKKDLKKQQQDQAQLELRLNRSVEENERYKQQLTKLQSNSKDHNEQEKKRVEQLQVDNKRLEKQKNELIQAFKKQLKLIDILKKQKMHLEAAKMLQFSEEEFLRALEWNQNGGNASNNPNYEPVQSQNNH